MTLSLDQLGERIAEQAAHLDAAMHSLLVDLRAFDVGSGWAKQGARSCAHWLAWRVGWTLATARDRVRVANRLADLPQTAAALSQGEVSYSKVRAITRVATPANESTLLGDAKHATASQLEHICRAYAAVQRGEQGTPADDRARRFVTRRELHDGRISIQAMLPPDEAAIVWAALEQIAARLARGADADELAGGASASAQATAAGSSADAAAADAATAAVSTAPATAATGSEAAVTLPAATTGSSPDPRAATQRQPAQDPQGAVNLQPAPAPPDEFPAGAVVEDRDDDRPVAVDPREYEDTDDADDPGYRGGTAVSWSGFALGGPHAPAGGAEPSPRASVRSFDRADALVALAQLAVRGGRWHRSPFEIVVTVSADTLADRGAPTSQVTRHDDRAPAAPGAPAPASVADGAFLSNHAVRRLACDAGILLVCETDRGEPLSVGRKTRTIPTAIRRALRRRDGDRCQFPGCTHRAFLEGHHFEHWVDGGATALTNLVLLCGFHHRFLHEHGYTGTIDEDGVATFVTERGEAVSQHPSPPPLGASLGWPAIHDRNAPIAITPETNAPGWNGSPLNLGLAIDELARADHLGRVERIGRADPQGRADHLGRADEAGCAAPARHAEEEA